MDVPGAALLEKLQQNHCKAAIVPIQFLNHLQRDMEDLCRSKVVSHDLIRKYLSHFQYDYSTVLPHARSVIIAAIPQPITVLSFTWRKNQQKMMVPPTYIYSEAEKMVFSIARNELTKQNYSLIRGKIPLKILAARTGLSQYGRNNITYISGLGSFYRLTALISDMPCDPAAWHDIQRMPDCSTCWACVNNCPTKCIDRDRDMIAASNCLTYINESSAPFPEWIRSNWHNALLGCMRCQLACPQNRTHSTIKDCQDFLSEADIDVLLQQDDFAKLPEKTRARLRNLNLTDYELTILQRNLTALLTY